MERHHNTRVIPQLVLLKLRCRVPSLALCTQATALRPMVPRHHTAIQLAAQMAIHNLLSRIPSRHTTSEVMELDTDRQCIGSLGQHRRLGNLYVHTLFVPTELAFSNLFHLRSLPELPILCPSPAFYPDHRMNNLRKRRPLHLHRWQRRRHTHLRTLINGESQGQFRGLSIPSRRKARAWTSITWDLPRAHSLPMEFRGQDRTSRLSFLVHHCGNLFRLALMLSR